MQMEHEKWLEIMFLCYAQVGPTLIYEADCHRKVKRWSEFMGWNLSQGGFISSLILTSPHIRARGSCFLFPILRSASRRRWRISYHSVQNYKWLMIWTIWTRNKWKCFSLPVFVTFLILLNVFHVVFQLHTSGDSKFLSHPLDLAFGFLPINLNS